MTWRQCTIPSHAHDTRHVVTISTCWFLCAEWCLGTCCCRFGGGYTAYTYMSTCARVHAYGRLLGCACRRMPSCFHDLWRIVCMSHRWLASVVHLLSGVVCPVCACVYPCACSSVVWCALCFVSCVRVHVRVRVCVRVWCYHLRVLVSLRWPVSYWWRLDASRRRRRRRSRAVEVRRIKGMRQTQHMPSSSIDAAVGHTAKEKRNAHVSLVLPVRHTHTHTQTCSMHDMLRVLWRCKNASRESHASDSTCARSRTRVAAHACGHAAPCMHAHISISHPHLISSFDDARRANLVSV